MTTKYVSLVTGASSGMGVAAARAFAARGDHVILSARRRDRGEEVARAIRDEGGSATFIGAEVTSAADVGHLFSVIADRHGRLDYAFNNAGVEGKWGPITELTDDDWDLTVGTNLKAVWRCIRHEVTLMQHGSGGAIVNNSSWLALGALGGGSIYSASKAGVDGLTRALAVELGPRKIRVNAVNPGFIDTEMFRRFFPPGEDDTSHITSQTPVRRLGSSEDIAAAVVWLCSDTASFVTGQTLLVDGGFTVPTLSAKQ